MVWRTSVTFPSTFEEAMLDAFPTAGVEICIENIRRRCHNRTPVGVFMWKPKETLEET
jgi:hypothetical protein